MVQNTNQVRVPGNVSAPVRMRTAQAAEWQIVLFSLLAPLINET
jgi:hypothetical protein